LPVARARPSTTTTNQPPPAGLAVRHSGYPAILFLALDNIFDLITHILRRRFRTPRPRQRTARGLGRRLGTNRSRRQGTTCRSTARAPPNRTHVRQVTSGGRAWRLARQALLLRLLGRPGQVSGMYSTHVIRYTTPPPPSFHQILPCFVLLCLFIYAPPPAGGSMISIYACIQHIHAIRRRRGRGRPMMRVVCSFKLQMKQLVTCHCRIVYIVRVSFFSKQRSLVESCTYLFGVVGSSLLSSSLQWIDRLGLFILALDRPDT
jgi:hypothetical protein